MATACPLRPELELADGTRLYLRALHPEDRQRFLALFGRLSPRSRYQRYLRPKDRFTARELSLLLEVDHISHEAIVAVNQRDGSVVGVARYVLDATRPSVAEVAVEVADELHHQGIGTALALRAIERAHCNGFRALTAWTLWENRAARALAGKLGFRARGSSGSTIELELPLR